jgi:hypothetical protein
MLVKYYYQNGEAIGEGGIEVPESPRQDFRSCFVFAFAKSGSVLVNAIVDDLMKECRIPIVDLSSHLFSLGIDISAFQADFTKLFPQRGYCFSGFRSKPHTMMGIEPIKLARRILIVRDPRDMLVSLYFSAKKSHQFTKGGSEQYSRLAQRLRRDTEMPIDEYCLHYSWIITGGMASFGDVIDDPDTLVIRYEDFIYDKLHLAKSMSDWLSLDVPPERLAAIASRHDVMPKSEQETQHIRQAHPGDHRRKLKPETITTLNAVLARFNSSFGYNTAADAAEERTPGLFSPLLRWRTSRG